jgi:4-hydroxy-tetrahydrodipicolinate synthase
MSTPLGTVLTAMVTPFDADGGLDLQRATELARWLVAHGNDGVVVAGTTGEAPTLSVDEHLALIEAVRQAVPDHVVIAGAGSNDTAHAVRTTERAAALGVDAILSVTPYYNRPSQAGMVEHYRAVAAATDRPILLYDIPGRTGRKVATDTMLRLFEELDGIVGVKDAAGNPGETAKLLARAPEGTVVYSGDDALTLPLLAVGAVGTIGVATHWVGAEVAEMIATFRKGDVDGATRLNARLIASYDYEGSDDAPNPVPTKVLLDVLGQPVGACRLPMGPAPDGLAERARAVLGGLGRAVT